MPSDSTGPVRPVLEGEPSRRPRWQAAGAVALGLVLLIGVLWVLGRDQTVEEATVTTTVAGSSTALASTTATTTTTTVPASALEGIVIYVSDGCADCSLLESTLRGLAGEVPVWVRPAEGTVSLLPTVVVQFDGRVRGQWVGRGAVNHPEAIAAFAGARWPSGTMPPPTTTTVVIAAAIPTTIVADPIAAEDIAPCFAFCRLVAVSAQEVWASMASSDARLIGHLKDGVWAFYRFELHFSEAPGLAVAPDGTVWAATSHGVFSFEGGVGTRRFDGPAGGVAVAPDGTVWAGGVVGGNRLWLARWEGESWVRVWGRQPVRDGVVSMAVSSDGAVWGAVLISGGYLVESGLMRYDGATMEPVPVGEYQAGEFSVFVIEAAPNGDLWIGGQIETDDALLPLLARFDGETWTTYDTGGLWARDITAGPDGVVWLATDGGLVSFDGTERITHIQGQDLLAVDVAPDGTVWYMDEQGVHILDTP